MPPLIATVVSSGLASWVELQTVLGVKDAYDLTEIITVDAYNRLMLQQQDD